MSTTKYTGPIVVGMKFWTSAEGVGKPECVRTVRSYDPGRRFQVQWDTPGAADSEEEFRSCRIPVDPPIDAPAEKRERRLAPGWKDLIGVGCHPCREAGRPFAGISVAGSPSGEYHCLPCAEAAGAFATPAPAKSVREPRAGWKLNSTFTCMKTDCWEDSVYDIESIDWSSAACEAHAEELGVFSGVDPRSARAKPADPKPAIVGAERARLKAEAQKKSAPAEKAKREPWVAQIEGAHVNAGVAKSYAEWAALQTGVAPGLEREKRAINVRGVRSIYLPSTESQGEKLARLVESGLRADVRQDETRFEAGLRGRR